jgi:hypothetical protein
MTTSDTWASAFNASLGGVACPIAYTSPLRVKPEGCQVAQQDSSTEIKYVKSSFSGGGNCVEAGRQADAGPVAVRHSTSHSTQPLLFTRDEWIAFLLGVKAGEFDFDTLPR